MYVFVKAMEGHQNLHFVFAVFEKKNQNKNKLLKMAKTQHNKIITFLNGLKYDLERDKMNEIYLKPKQIRAIDMLYHGRDILPVFPTGYGKSVIFQLFPFIGGNDKSNIRRRLLLLVL